MSTQRSCGGKHSAWEDLKNTANDRKRVPEAAGTGEIPPPPDGSSFAGAIKEKHGRGPRWCRQRLAPSRRGVGDCPVQLRNERFGSLANFIFQRLHGQRQNGNVIAYPAGSITIGRVGVSLPPAFSMVTANPLAEIPSDCM